MEKLLPSVLTDTAMEATVIDVETGSHTREMGEKEPSIKYVEDITVSENSSYVSDSAAERRCA